MKYTRLFLHFQLVLILYSCQFLSVEAKTCGQYCVCDVDDYSGASVLQGCPNIPPGDSPIHLDLSKYKITSISNGAFDKDNKERIASIDLSHNSIISIPFKVFAPLKQLTSLRMHKAFSFTLFSSPTLGANFFRENNFLEVLDLSANTNCVEVNDGAFNGLVSLKHLDLRQTIVGYLPLTLTMFKDLLSLEYLDLSSNNVQGTIPDGYFSEMSQLSYLNISGFNNVGIFYGFGTPKNVFSQNTKLETLDLSQTTLGGIRLNSDTLKWLSLSYWDFTQDFKIDFNVPNLEVLHLDHIKFSSNFGENFSEFPALKDLTMIRSTCRSSRNSGFFFYLKNIESLDLSEVDWDMGPVPEDFNGLDKLVNLTLYFSSSFTCAYGGQFPRLQALEKLDLTATLDAFDFCSSNLVSNLHNLKWLSMAKNYMNFSWFNFANPSLEYLDLSTTATDEVNQQMFGQSQSLKHLNLSDMEYFNSDKNTILSPSAFQYLQNLQSVDLSKSKVTLLPVSIFDASTQLQVINLNGNMNLNTVEEGVIEDLAGSSWVMDLTGDNLNCDCRISWMTTSKYFYNTIGGTCQLPAEYYGKSVNGLNIPPCQ